MGVQVSGFASITQSLESVPRRLRDKAARAGFIVQCELVESPQENVNRSGRSTGALSGSWEFALVSASPGTFTFGVFSDLPYAQIHDTGGIIRPVRAKALAVPMTSRARKMGPREWPADKLRYIPIDGGSIVALLALRGRKGRGNTQYLLMKEVDLSGTGYIRKARRSAIPKVSEYLSNALVDTVEGR